MPDQDSDVSSDAEITIEKLTELIIVDPCTAVIVFSGRRRRRLYIWDSSPQYFGSGAHPATGPLSYVIHSVPISSISVSYSVFHCASSIKKALLSQR